MTDIHTASERQAYAPTENTNILVGGVCTQPQPLARVPREKDSGNKTGFRIEACYMPLRSGRRSPGTAAGCGQTGKEIRSGK